MRLRRARPHTWTPTSRTLGQLLLHRPRPPVFGYGSGLCEIRIPAENHQPQDIAPLK
jgi:hypothetical protein